MDINSSTTIPGVRVFFPDALRARVGNRASVMVTGSTVREIIEALDQDFPGLRFNGATIYILQSVAGG